MAKFLVLCDFFGVDHVASPLWLLLGTDNMDFHVWSRSPAA